jgi:hypothetical protein
LEHRSTIYDRYLNKKMDHIVDLKYKIFKTILKILKIGFIWYHLCPLFKEKDGSYPRSCIYEARDKVKVEKLFELSVEEVVIVNVVKLKVELFVENL